MRTYDKLTTDEKHNAEEVAREDLLRDIIEGALHFDDKANNDGLQARIDAAMEKAAEMQTPWFVHEYILDTCEDELWAMAQADAEEALYPDPSERIIHLT